ncbi:unnamed protein product [Brassica rapa subsp. narinosa]
MLLRSHGSSSSSELLPDDLVELILEHVPVMPLLRFRSVSKKWKLTIESQRFGQRHLIRRKQLRGPDVLILSHSTLSLEDEPLDDRIFGLGTSIVWTVKLPITCDMYCHGTCESCDGLFCTFGIYNTPSVVANPATGWYRILPLSNYQHLCQTYMRKGYVDFPGLGFGRDKLRGTFKAVWLYNASGFVPKQDKVVTYCEVFDFTTNAWRYVVASSPYPIPDYHLGGSLYWFTECDDEPPMVLSFDLHTETFQVICKAPFAHPCDPGHLTMHPR